MLAGPISYIYDPNLNSRPCFNIKTVFPRYGSSRVKDKTFVRPSYHNRLIFNMGIPVLIRRHPYIETAPWPIFSCSQIWAKIAVSHTRAKTTNLDSIKYITLFLFPHKGIRVKVVWYLSPGKQGLSPKSMNNNEHMDSKPLDCVRLMLDKATYVTTCISVVKYWAG